MCLSPQVQAAACARAGTHLQCRAAPIMLIAWMFLVCDAWMLLGCAACMFLAFAVCCTPAGTHQAVHARRVFIAAFCAPAAHPLSNTCKAGIQC